MQKLLNCLLGKEFPDGLVVRNQPAILEMWVWSLGWEDPLEEEMASHSSILAWKSPLTEEPIRLQSITSQRLLDNASNVRYGILCWKTSSGHHPQVDHGVILVLLWLGLDQVLSRAEPPRLKERIQMKCPGKGFQSHPPCKWWVWHLGHGDSDGKESACSAEDPHAIPGLGKSPGEGHSNPL